MSLRPCSSRNFSYFLKAVKMHEMAIFQLALLSASSTAFCQHFLYGKHACIPSHPRIILKQHLTLAFCDVCMHVFSLYGSKALEEMLTQDKFPKRHNLTSLSTSTVSANQAALLLVCFCRRKKQNARMQPTGNWSLVQYL